MDYFKIAQITNTHGCKGEVKVYPYTDDITKLSKTKVYFLDENLEKKLEVESSKIQNSFLIIKFKNVNSMDEAVLLKNKLLYIEKKEKVLEVDTYYIKDLIGIDVVTTSNDNEEYIGVIEYVFNTGANDIYEVKTPDNKLIYIPAIKDVVKKVDIQNKKVYIELMEGLI